VNPKAETAKNPLKNSLISRATFAFKSANVTVRAQHIVQHIARNRSTNSNPLLFGTAQSTQSRLGNAVCFAMLVEAWTNRPICQAHIRWRTRA
jgi:hypothetical protein